MSRVRLLLTFASAATIALGLPATTAHAQPTVTCGMTIGTATSITLTHDLNCPGTALTVARDSGPAIAVTVDLGGHTISSATGPTIEARDFATTTTIRNGRLVVGDGAAIVHDEGAGNVYDHVTFDGGTLISVNDSSPHILHCRFIHGASIFSDQNTIDIEHNSFSGPGATSSSAAMTLAGTFSTVIGNTVAGYGTGIGVFGDLASADVRDNVILRSGTGIRIVGPGSPAQPLMPTNVKNNVVIAGQGDGIVIGDGTNATVTANTTLLNGGDGIRFDPTPAFDGRPAFGVMATLSRNVSLANVQWGIEAPVASAHVAVVDGGHNTAHFNGAGQCLNFTCH